MKKLFVLVLFSLNSFATPWVSNRDHSEVHFQVPYMQVSEVSGRFDEFTSEADFDEKTKTFKNLKVSIRTESIDTGNKMRDGHLEGSDFLEARVHPEIIFTSNNIKLTGSTYKATGELSIKGIKKPSMVEFTLTDSMKDTWGYENRFVKFKSSVNRKDYNITWNKTLDGKQLLVGDTISFWGTFQMQPAEAKTPNSKHMIPDTEVIRKRDGQRQNNEPVEESFISKKLKSLINGK
jgi:polyisoprenoid-binding protein YceI